VVCGGVHIFLRVLYILPQPHFHTHTCLFISGQVDGSGSGAGSSSAKASARRRRWLVEFYAVWAQPCTDLYPVFAGLSNVYTSERLSFAKIDVSRYPTLASQFRIDTSGSTKQLPTLVLFADGKEVKRMPEVSRDGKVGTARFDAE
jgi:hypothetical protein